MKIEQLTPGTIAIVLCPIYAHGELAYEQRTAPVIAVFSSVYSRGVYVTFAGFENPVDVARVIALSKPLAAPVARRVKKAATKPEDKPFVKLTGKDDSGLPIYLVRTHGRSRAYTVRSGGCIGKWCKLRGDCKHVLAARLLNDGINFMRQSVVR